MTPAPVLCWHVDTLHVEASGPDGGALHLIGTVRVRCGWPALAHSGGDAVLAARGRITDHDYTPPGVPADQPAELRERSDPAGRW